MHGGATSGITGGARPEARVVETLEDGWMLWCATIGNLLTRSLIKKHKYAHLAVPCSRQAWPLGTTRAGIGRESNMSCY